MNRLEFLNKELGVDLISMNGIDWRYISINKKLSEEFIREFQNKFNWVDISCHQKLSEDFIREFKDKLDWTRISTYQKLSEDFIKEFQNRVNWSYISMYQKLSENFIRKFKNYVDWKLISKYQKLSEDFICEFQNKVDWDCISKHQKLSKKFRNEFKLVIDKNNWIYKTTNFKKKQIIDCGLYECYEDYFIAYKAIRNDRYSHFNFQYQYLPNLTYEAHCDCTGDEVSFGLSVWTYDKANDYDDSGLIIKVKVKYEDVGRLVHGSNKVRCSKIEIFD